jgi:hypothetical protein
LKWIDVGKVDSLQKAEALAKSFMLSIWTESVTLYLKNMFNYY